MRRHTVPTQSQHDGEAPETRPQTCGNALRMSPRFSQRVVREDAFL